MRQNGPVKYIAVAGLAVLLFVPGCGNREQAAPPATTPQPPATAGSATTTTTLPTPPPVWRTARWGMTRDEVLAAFPSEAQRLAQPAAFGPTAPGSSDVAIPVYEGEGAKFRVLFGFESNALSRVHLTAIQAGDATCEEVEKVLTEKHAAPLARTNTGTSLRGEEIVWKRPDQTITLGCAGVHSLGFRSVTLAYTPPG